VIVHSLNKFYKT